MNSRKKSIGFVVVNTKTGERVSTIFKRRGPAREELVRIARSKACPECGVSVGALCLHNGAPMELVHPRRSGIYLGVEQVTEYV